MVKIKGKETRYVDVELSSKDLIISLAEVFGVKNFIAPEYKSYSDLKQIEDKYYIITYDDDSRHGSPWWNESDRKEISKEGFELGYALKNAKKLL